MCSCTIFQESRDSPTVFVPRVEDLIGVGQEDLVGELIVLMQPVVVFKDTVVSKLGS